MVVPRWLDPTDTFDRYEEDLLPEMGDVVGDQRQAIRVTTLRRAAARLCPCARHVLVGATAGALRGLLPPEMVETEAIQADVDALLETGDLLSGRETSGGRVQTSIYLSPPMFIRRSATSVFVIGGLPEAGLPVHENIRTVGFYRQITPSPEDQELLDQGLSQLPLSGWIESPTMRTPSELMDQLDATLQQAGPAGEGLDLTILDTTSARNDYYLGRFVGPAHRTGTFLARRRRRWGGNIWCYADVESGVARRYVDFPQVDRRFSGRDEAWWAICALDASQGHPQPMRRVETTAGIILAFNTPLPTWAERRLITVGSSSDWRPKGALAAFLVDRDSADDEERFLREVLWLETIAETAENGPS